MAGGTRLDPPPIPPLPPVGIRKESRQAPGLTVEQFSLQIDGRPLDCGAAELGAGNRAPYAYQPGGGAYSGELQMHAARCRLSF
jgi:hypothetical protein